MEREPGEEIGWLDNPCESQSEGECPMCGEEVHDTNEARQTCERSYLKHRLGTDRAFRRAFHREIDEDSRFAFLKDSYNQTLKELWEENYMKPTTTYAGAGSKDAPEDVQKVMQETGKRFHEKGWVLRSGGEGDPEKGFMMMYSRLTKTRIFLPFDGYNSWVDTDRDCGCTAVGENMAARELARAGPGFDDLDATFTLKRTRDVCRVLGKDLRSPARRVICWTPDGAETASDCGPITDSSYMVIRLATRFDIPVDNLSNENTFERYAECIR
jgi:hypothetical protein